MYRQARALLLITLICGVGNRLDAEEAVRQHEQYLFDMIDRDHDGVVSLAVLARAMALEFGDNIEPRQFSVLKRYDGDQNGEVTLREFAQGQRSLMKRQIDRAMGTDIDGDDRLTLKEYALGVPDPKGNINAQGVTPRQVKAFSDFDLDDDGAVTRDEVQRRYVELYRNSFEMSALANRVIALDQDGDRQLDLTEFAALYSPSGVDEQARTVFESLTKKNGKATVRSLRAYLFALPPDQLAEFKDRIESLDRRTPSES